MVSGKQEKPSSETRFSSDPPANGTRVDRFPDGPNRFRVKVWIHGRPIEDESFPTKEAADRFASEAQRRITDASRP
jgi:hypothetical protein